MESLFCASATLCRGQWRALAGWEQVTTDCWKIFKMGRGPAWVASDNGSGPGVLCGREVRDLTGPDLPGMPDMDLRRLLAWAVIAFWQIHLP